jgi:hypothetical protein
VADPESFLWVGTQYRNSAPQYATVLATMLRYLGHRESEVVLGLPKTLLGPPLDIDHWNGVKNVGPMLRKKKTSTLK